MLIYLCDAFVSWWVFGNHFINYLYGVQKRYKEDGIGDNGGSFFGCFVG